jgi:hypothetical protein
MIFAWNVRSRIHDHRDAVVLEVSGRDRSKGRGFTTTDFHGVRDARPVKAGAPDDTPDVLRLRSYMKQR